MFKYIRLYFDALQIKSDRYSDIKLANTQQGVECVSLQASGILYWAWALFYYLECWSTFTFYSAQSAQTFNSEKSLV